MLKAAPALSALLLAACASTVYAPSVLVLPGSKKTFDQFRFDEQSCRGYAQAQLTDSGSEWGGTTQQRYDRAFVQCMYAKGHKVPVSGRYFDAEPQAAVPTPPPPAQPPTPPPATQAQPPTPPPPPTQPPTPQTQPPAPPPPPQG